MNDHSSNCLKKVLLVDDNDEGRILMKWYLDYIGYSVDTAPNAVEALSMFDSKVYDLVLTDNSMPGMAGVELAHIVKLKSPATPILMYSGNPPHDRSCLDVVILKPAHLDEIKEAMGKLLSAK